MTPRKSPGWLYSGIALAALGAAIYTALGVSPPQSGAAAYVNGTAIPQAEYSRAVKAMQAGLERPLTQRDKDRAINLLIDEELIVQDSLRLGLAANDRLVRKNLVQAMMRSVTSLGFEDEISEDRAKAFYKNNAALFAQPKRLWLQTAAMTTQTQNQQFLKALEAGLSFAEAAGKAGGMLQKLPEGIPIGKVNDLLGGDGAGLAAKMKTGDIAGPVRSGGQEIFIWLTAVSGGSSEFEPVKAAVIAEIERRRDEAALEAYVDTLRRKSRVKIGVQSP